MKGSLRYILMTLIAVAFIVPGCGGPAVEVPVSNPDAGELKGGPNGKGKHAGDKSKPKKNGSAGAAKGSLEGGGFSYGDDEGGKILAERLTPHRLAPAPSTGHALHPRPDRVLPLDVDVDIPIPPTLAEPPRPLGKTAPPMLRPSGAAVEYPLGWDLSDPELPAKTVLPETARARAPSVGSNAPARLPPLGTPQPDRAGLADPSAGYSLAAATGAVVPALLNKAPFAIFNLPDPFENRKTIRLLKVPDERLPLTTGSAAPRK
jgi:hypothetical protein